jgi:hypothetical protein
MFREAKELLPHLPTAEGEATHAVMSGRYDLMVLLAAVLEFYASGCESLRIATLSFNDRNTLEMAELLRSGRVGTLALLCSAFFKAHNDAEYSQARRTAAEFPGRWRIAAARNHAKVITAHLPGQRRKLVLEGSANLRTNGNWEQLLIVLDDNLHDWHAAWIDAQLSKHEADDAPEPETKPPPPKPARPGHFRHAGLGVWCCRRGLSEPEETAFRAWKAAPSQHEVFCAAAAEALAALIRQWQQTVPADWIITAPPPGASAGREYPASLLGKALARKLGLEYQTTLQRAGGAKKWHGRHYALKQEPFTVTCKPPSVALVVDDMMTSGITMRLALDALRTAGVPAFGFAYVGND